MQRMNPKAHKKQNGHSHALERHKNFKGDCNAAPREDAKKGIESEIVLMKENTMSKEKPVNALTDEECEKILELSKRSDLILEGCGHGQRYFGLTVDERKLLKEDVEFLETTLIKWIPDLVSFSNFCTGKNGTRIRCQTRWSENFTGVSYFDLPHNNDWKIVDENDEVVDDLVGLTLRQAEDAITKLLNEGADVYIQNMND